jgi:hypothetical protein
MSPEEFIKKWRAVGILLCRSFDNKGLFMKRCKDTAKDDRGFIMVFDDDDLAALVAARKDGVFYQQWKLLRTQSNALIS